MKKEFIEIYDDVIPLSLQNYIENLCIYPGKFPWFYQDNMSGEKKDTTCGFSHILYTKFNPIKTSIDFIFNFLQIPYLFSNYLNLNIKDIYSQRLFLQTPSPSPRPIYEGIHIDLNVPHSVCLYYISDSDGDTIFFKDDMKTEIKRVSPKKGRIAFFSGNIPHCSSTPKENTRIILNTTFSVEPFGEKK